MTLNETPRANRLHIGLFGKRNTGKSSLINALTGQKVSLVSDVAGTTTDPVYKSMEIHGIGPCVLIDTAGFDDTGSLGNLRIEQTKKAMAKTDVAIMLFAAMPDQTERRWLQMLKQQNTPVITVLNKLDILSDNQMILDAIEHLCGTKPLLVSAKTGQGIELVRQALINALPDDFGQRSITNGLVQDGDTVLLCMPQDIQAPRGRLILPQVQTLRELLDKKCLVMSVTTDKLPQALQSLVKPPKLIITDSQVFKTVYEQKPKESMLTSFSTLFAQYKGDIDYFVKSTKAFETLTERSKILIAEACTHVPLKEDIGREKLPRLLRARFGKNLQIDHVNGADFPEDLHGYALVIQCGACMFNRKYVMSRVQQAKEQGVPMSNYGVVLAYLTDILDKIDY